MVKKLVIIGGGPAGNAAALAAVDAGASEIVVVERDAMGGTCTNRGCIPTKFLLSRSEAYASSKLSAPPQDDWGRLVAHKTALARGLAKSIETTCASRGIRIVRGRARFVGPSEVEVVDAGGQSSRIDGEAFIVATGSQPAQLAAAPADGRVVITSDDALDLATLPPAMAVIGSGAVGAEFAFLFARLGVKVTLIEAAGRLFPLEDPDVDGVLRRVYERLGVGIRVGSPVVGIERRGDGAAVLLGSGEAVEAPVVLVGIGRTLGTAGLGCEAAGIATGPRGQMVVDDALRTSQPHIFGAGDVTGRMLLAHAASFMGAQAARRACGADAREVPYRSIPWATYTTPEVAAVGLTTTAAAEAAGLRAVSTGVPLMESVKARIDRTTEGFIKVVAERGSGVLLGGTIVGPHASDLIHMIALAVHQRLTVSDMRGFTFAHPSISELIGDLYAIATYD
ncbi:MAG TPA: NAD(P)/FAD-dependent oxidoreductase [bacterium]